MASLSVALGITRSSGDAQRPSAGPPGKAPLDAEIRQKIFERDNHTCRACGFRSQKYQDIHFLNGAARDATPENMATACIFCHQCFALDKVGEMRSGVLVWLPELKQTDLHHLARAIYVARISQGPVADAARKSLDILMQRRDEARARLGTDDPFILSAVLKDYISDKAYASRGAKLEGIKLFPLDRRIIREADLEFNQFPQILAYWRSKDGPFGSMVPKQWINLYAQLKKNRLTP